MAWRAGIGYLGANAYRTIVAGCDRRPAHMQETASDQTDVTEDATVRPPANVQPGQLAGGGKVLNPDKYIYFATSLDHLVDR